MQPTILLGRILSLVVAMSTPITMAAQIQPAKGGADSVLATMRATDEARSIMQDVLAQRGSAALRAQLQGVQPPGGNVIGVRVFLNKADANWRTPITDPHYVTSLAFGQGGEESFVLSLAEVARSLAATKALDLEKPLTLSFVPTTGDEDKVPTGKPLVVERVNVVAVPK